MRDIAFASSLSLAAFLWPLPALAADQPPDTLRMEHPPSKYEIVVSATRTPRNPVDVPNATTVIRGAELKRRGVHTLAEALQDVTGLDTGEGSDNGSRLPNVGMWGLKEFDALLFMLDGVPVGGPFNPSLSQIPVEDVDRIEIAKGPQGTLYGVSAFAGMIQVFTPGSEGDRRFSAGGGSFAQGNGHFGWGTNLAADRSLRFSGAYQRSDGWQDRTESNVERGGAAFGFGLGRGRMTLTLTGLRDEQDWGSPLPFEDGELVPGFRIDRNYAVRGAVVKHQVFGTTSQLAWPLGSRHRIENTLGVTRDEQKLVRSFPGEVSGDTLKSDGVALEPTETSVYEDVRAVLNLRGAGTHELVTGAALTWGTTRGGASEFEFDQLLSAYPSIPSLADVGPSEERDFEDRRTFFGAYAHDTWTPLRRLTLGGGLRFDAASEELETEADLPSGPQPVKDEREDQDVSGDVSALVRLAPETGTRLQAANLYASFRRAFKPAAPNLAEAEAAEILEPERTSSWEVGLKTRALDQIALDLSWFDMNFKNLVVSILGPGGGPELTNAGEQRFHGFETDLRWAPPAFPGAELDVGYAHHSARFVDFTFVTPDSQFRDVSGNRLELVPRDMLNARASLHTALGPGGFVAVRWQGERPFNRRNTVFAAASTEWDAGLSYDRGPWRTVVTGRNLGDERHVVTESEIGDAEFYVAPPRRFTAELSYRF